MQPKPAESFFGGPRIPSVYNKAIVWDTVPSQDIGGGLFDPAPDSMELSSSDPLSPLFQAKKPDYERPDWFPAEFELPENFEFEDERGDEMVSSKLGHPLGSLTRFQLALADYFGAIKFDRTTGEGSVDWNRLDILMNYLKDNDGASPPGSPPQYGSDDNHHGQDLPEPDDMDLSDGEDEAIEDVRVHCYKVELAVEKAKAGQGLYDYEINLLLTMYYLGKERNAWLWPIIKNYL